MKDQDIRDQIRTAVQHSVPDVLDSILANLDVQKGHVIPMNSQQVNQQKKRSLTKPWALIAAVFAILAVGIMGFNVYEQRAVDSIISLDVNPSIEMKVNKKEKVLEVMPLNEDGKIIVGEMDFEGTDLEVAVNALIGSMLKNGYISEIQNSILVSVEHKDETKRAALQAKLTEEIDHLLRAYSIDAAIVSQPVADDDQLKTIADQYAITKGKAQVVQQLVDLDPKYQFEDLAKLSINELNLLAQSKQLELAGASTVGAVSDKAYLGKDNAVQAALSHAGVASAAVKGLEVELDYDDGIMVYEIEFYADGFEYEYDIDAVSGAILSFEKDRDDDDDFDDDRYDDDYDDDDWYDDDDDDDRYDDDDDRDDDRKGNQGKVTKPTVSNPAGPTTTPAAPAAEQPANAPSKTDQSASSRMSAAEARKAVLDQFGGIIQKIEYNYDERNPLYKGEALKSGQKVVFELNARTRTFDKWDVGNDNKWDEFSHALSDLITMDEAANLVINKSGKSDTFVQKIDFLWDDSEPMYQGEAFNRGVKYSFEIDAYSGKFFKWDADRGDETWEEKYDNVK